MLATLANFIHNIGMQIDETKLWTLENCKLSVWFEKKLKHQIKIIKSNEKKQKIITRVKELLFALPETDRNGFLLNKIKDNKTKFSDDTRAFLHVLAVALDTSEEIKDKEIVLSHALLHAISIAIHGHKEAIIMQVSAHQLSPRDIRNGFHNRKRYGILGPNHNAKHYTHGVELASLSCYNPNP